MIELTEEEFKGDLAKYTTRIEHGEDFLIKKSSGEKYIATDITKFKNPPSTPCRLAPNRAS